MIKDSIQNTIRLIEDIQREAPAAYQEDEIALDYLVRHMRLVIDSLERHHKVA